ncbi:MAG: hypothetical protein AAF399_11190 [Bacteroidota bacterium]
MASHKGHQYSLRLAGKPLSVRAVFALWQESADFRDFYTRSLVEVPFAAFFWETSPVNQDRLEQAFEWVVLDSPGLAQVNPEPETFAEYFQTEANVVRFANLRGDARLVVPRPLTPDSAYPHLAAFLRSAPREQLHAFWQAVGKTMSAHLSERPTWLSTAGMGVYWLHARLDSRPKYYRYGPYRKWKKAHH